MWSGWIEKCMSKLGFGLISGRQEINLFEVSLDQDEDESSVH